MKELLLGCGYQRHKFVTAPGTTFEWQDLYTADHNRTCKPDLNCNLDYSRFKIWRVNDFTVRGSACIEYSQNDQIKESFFQEVHAYEVLEHLGRQGDIGSFFHTFNNIYRVLCAGGYLCATVPSRFSPWLWGDPGHCRVIYKESLTFLDRSCYSQIGATAMSDYREVSQCDFKLIHSEDDRTFHKFVLQAIKPMRKI